MPSRWSAARIEAFRVAVHDSKSMAATLRALHMRVASANYVTLRRWLKKLELDTSHWTRKGHRLGSRRPVVEARPLNEVLVRGYRCSSHKLKLRLIADGLFQPVCEGCQLSEWRGRPIPLELHHEDGDHFNNEFSNLSLLCPNCHAQTEFYAGRNDPKRRHDLFQRAGVVTSASPSGGKVYTGDLSEELSPLEEIPEVKPVKFGERPGPESEPTPSQALVRGKV